MNPNIPPAIAVIAGILVLFMPRLLAYIVGLALIVMGLHELNRIHQWAPGLVFTQMPASLHSNP